jgi:hypothetical protein
MFFLGICIKSFFKIPYAALFLPSQIRPVIGKPIFQAMMESIASPPIPGSPEHLALDLLKSVEVFYLTEQQRSLHPVHNANISAITKLDPKIFPITPAILRSYPAISQEEIQSDPLWRKASIVVPTNAIRHSINLSQIKSLARQLDLPVLFWRNKLTTSELTNAEIENLYATKAALSSYFVPTALSYITENISTAKGLVNGTACTFHSITPHPDEDAVRLQKEMQTLADSLKHAAPGDMVELALPPLSINVQLNDQPTASFTSEDSLLQDQYVVPIPLSPYPKYDSLKPKDLLRRPTTTSNRVGYITHGVELGFSCTFHKVQVFL